MLLPITIWCLAVYSLYNLNSLYVQIAEIQNRNLLVHLKSEWLRFSIVSIVFLASAIYAILRIAHHKYQADYGNGIVIKTKDLAEEKKSNDEVIALNKTPSPEKDTRIAL